MNSLPTTLQPQEVSSWEEVENKIQQEISWLKEKLETFFEKEDQAPITCKDCILRNIAILIVSGKIQASEIKKDLSLNSFWNGKISTGKHNIRHGSDWHREKMQEIKGHFLAEGYEVAREPTLSYGRADLGIYKEGMLDLFIEVGTVSLFKLWQNLETTEKAIFLIIPNNEQLVEFIKT